MIYESDVQSSQSQEGNDLIENKIISIVDRHLGVNTTNHVSSSVGANLGSIG